MPSLKTSLLTLNLFAPAPDSNEVESDQKRRWNIIATRVYIIILLLALFFIGLIFSLIDQTTLATMKYPTKKQYEALPKDAQCACSRISLLHGKFTALETNFHQVCSSDFVSDRWFQAIDSGANSTYFFTNDFRTFGSAQFQALAGFCRLSKTNIEQSIASFYLNTLISPQVLSEIPFQSQIQASIDEFRSTAPNAFRSQLRLVNQLTVNNKLMSGLMTNSFYLYLILYDIYPTIEQMIFRKIQDDGSVCQCPSEFCGKVSSGIYDIFRAPTPLQSGNMTWKIPGIVAGCLPVVSILYSTLECFYSEICLNKLISYFPSNENFAAMSLLEQSLYSPNSTLQLIIDNLMIEKWKIDISYDNYYSECAPSSCTYSQVSKHSFIFVLTKLISLLATLTLLLGLGIPLVIQLIQQIGDRTPSPKIPSK
jgi:hypothetical protein